MSISRRDTILLAVLINVGLLALLFMTAIQSSDDMTVVATSLPEPIVVVPHEEIVIAPIPNLPPATPVDEVDNAIKAYTEAPSIAQEQPVTSPVVVVESSEKETVEITVKKGDTLEKIAKANKTTPQEIRKINQLSNDKLTVGQTLKVTVNKSSKPVAMITGDPLYYTLKSGDSPWKIAKQFKVNYEDILKLNGLSEEKARNLKIGDQIRIK